MNRSTRLIFLLAGVILILVAGALLVYALLPVQPVKEIFQLSPNLFNPP